jgi:hypothetical protein
MIFITLFYVDKIDYLFLSDYVSCALRSIFAFVGRVKPNPINLSKTRKHDAFCRSGFSRESAVYKNIRG